MSSLANAIAGQPSTPITGTWFRHLPARYATTAMDGRASYSRWGRDRGFPLLYLGQPPDSVIVEAYRHLIDPVVDAPPGYAATLTPRVMVTATVSVTNILDMRTSRARMETGLTLQQMQSDTNDDAAYASCQEVASAAHQQGFHGLIAPAATQRGETLVLFTNRLPPAEVPTVTNQELWTPFPSDPRIASSPSLRIVRDD